VDEYIPSQPFDSAEASDPAYRPPAPLPARPRIRLPLILFGLTCLSTLVAGGARTPEAVFGDYSIQFDWWNGLIYMASVMGILLAHEMGHFLQAVRHGIPASLPFFLPMPLSPVGTLGAFIGMQGTRADRKQLFDIGLTGPWAGFIVALPLACYGISIARPIADPPPGTYVLMDPLVLRWLIAWLRPELPAGQIFESNPFYLAAWFGMLLTGLNMAPVSQLDGGHTAYALFGRQAARLVARLFVVSVIAMIVQFRAYDWIAMLVLVVVVIGIDHPPTRDDTVSLGPLRRIIGYASLTIPLFCLSPMPVMEWR
jgi:membrane-associated protease RseP (regulator of RpoE activity)